MTLKVICVMQDLSNAIRQTFVRHLQYNTIQYKICKAPCCRGFRGFSRVLTDTARRAVPRRQLSFLSVCVCGQALATISVRIRRYCCKPSAHCNKSRDSVNNILHKLCLSLCNLMGCRVLQINHIN